MANSADYGKEDLIVLALALGAAAGLKPTAEQAIKDGYATLKTLIQRKYGKVDVALLEQRPASENRRAVVQEDLAQAGTGQDEEVVHAAQALLAAIQRQTPETAGAIGVRLEDLEAAAVTLSETINVTVGERGIGLGKVSGNARGTFITGDNNRISTTEGQRPRDCKGRNPK